MPVRSRTRLPLTAAFWLLVAAWVCVNLRPGTVASACSWLAEARSFSHQQRLAADVVALLAGAATAPTEIAAGDSAPPPRPAAPALPEGGFKKLEAPLARLPQVHAPAPEIAGRIAAAPLPRGRSRAAPPHGPPRTTNAS